MGKKGSWFSAIKRFFLPCSKEKLNNESDKRSNKEKKKGLGKLRRGENNAFLPLFRKPSSIEKILGEAEREHNLIFRPSSPPEQPIVPRRPASPQVHSSRGASSRGSSKSVSPPRVASPSPPHPPPPRAGSPQVASPRGVTTKASPPRIVDPEPEPTLRNQHASATQIQAAYRGYKARRSFRSLKALVRLQGVVRGQNARRQTTNAMKQMQLLVRVQSQIQSRRIQLFENQAQDRFKNDKEAESTLGKWISQASEAGNKNWDYSVITKEEREARQQRKEEAAIKMRRAMSYAYSNQLWRGIPETARTAVSSLPSGSQWWWSRLDRRLPLLSAHESKSMKSFQTPPRQNSEWKPSSRPQSSSSKQRQFTSDNFIETPTPKSTRSTVVPATKQMQTPSSSSGKRLYPRSSRVASPFNTNIKDDDSLISCPQFSVPNYMNPTISTKAKVRPSSNPRERYVGTPRSESNRRLSYPFAQGVGSFRSNKGSVSNMSVDSTLSTPTNASDGRKPFNRFV